MSDATRATTRVEYPIRLLAFALCFSAALLGVRVVGAQVYPARPITVVVPVPAGSPTDSLARILADRMRRSLGQPLVVENVVGAGGSLGIGHVVRADPDGYTLVLGNWNTHVSAGAVYRVRYDVLKELEPIARLPVSRLWLVGAKVLPARNAAELIVWLKAASSGATAAIVGAGSAAHLCAIDIERKTGAHLRLVSYHGGPPAYQDLVGGHIDLMCAEASATLPYVREGKLNAYAVFAKERWPLAPDVPTLDEVGVPGPYVAFWHGLWAPRGTPADIVFKLNAAVDEALRDPVVGIRIAALGQELPSPEERTPQALGRYHKAEVERWWPIIKEVGIKAD